VANVYPIEVARLRRGNPALPDFLDCRASLAMTGPLACAPTGLNTSVFTPRSRSGNDFDRSETLRKQRIVNDVFAFDQ
jgi:hypothetical protein